MPRTVRGIEADLGPLDRMIAGFEPKAALLVRRTAENVVSRARRSMDQPKSGHEYRRRGRTHRASAPGEAPAVDLGNLRAALFADMTGPIEAVVGVGRQAPYAPSLEFGGAALAPRPFLTPAIETERPRFERGVQALFR